jgi:hypothetical protein
MVSQELTICIGNKFGIEGVVFAKTTSGNLLRSPGPQILENLNWPIFNFRLVGTSIY